MSEKRKPDGNTKQELIKQVYLGDSFEIMDKLVEEGIKVDAIITDPPFNLVEKQGGSIHLFRQSEQEKRNTINKDTMSYDIGFDQISWIEKASKLLKKGGAIVIFNDWENMGDIAKELRKHGIKVKSLNHWQKTNPLPNEWRRRFVTGREYFIYGVKKGAKHTFNVDSVHNGCFRYSLTPLSEKKLGSHPNQKPIELMKEIISILTNPGDIVLDPFAGSGSTLVACEILNRGYIGIEKEKQYYDLINERLKHVGFIA